VQQVLQAQREQQVLPVQLVQLEPPVLPDLVEAHWIKPMILVVPVPVKQ